MPPLQVRTHTDAMLAAVIAATTALSIPVGDGHRPDDPAVPYAVVHNLPSGMFDGSLSAPNDDGSPLFQVSSWGASREQSQGVADRIRDHLLTPGTVTIVGRAVLRVELSTVGGTFRADDDGESPALFHTPDRYRLHTTPE